MITNLKTTNKSSRQKKQDAKRKKTIQNLVRNFDSYAYQIENSDNPKIKRMVELGKKHMPLAKIMEIVDKEFPEE